MKRLFNTIAVIVFAVILSVGAVACGSGSNTETEKSSEVVRSTDESKKDTDLKTSQKKGTKKEESDKKSDSAASADKSDKDAAKESSTSADQSSSNASSSKSNSSSNKPSGNSSSSHSGSSASKPSSNSGSSSKPSNSGGNSGSTSTPTPEPSQPAHQHSYTSSITTQPTCSTPGVRTYTCVSGDDSYTESIPATGHNWVDNVETVEHSDPIWKVICNGCGAQFDDAHEAGLHVAAVFGDACSSTSNQIVGYNTYSETVSHGQICKVCGATK